MKTKDIITIPRIIGIVLIILAIIVQVKLQQLSHAIILAIAGLILALAPNTSAKKNLKDVITSFRLKKEFAIIMFIDAMTFVACALLTILLYKIILANAEALNAIPASPSLAPESLAAYNTILGKFFLYSGIALAAFYLATIIVYTISRGLVWLVLLGKKPELGFFARLGLLNLVWYTIWTVLALFFMITMKPEGGVPVIIVLLLLYTHLTTALHYSYAKVQEMKKSLIEAFRKGLGKIPAFAQPYCYILIVYVIISQAIHIGTGKFALAIAFTAYFAFMAWYRIYMRNVLRQI
ncbi:MAG: hypothetical protein QXT19_00925 [Candidatus Woesearchaeota archaeon]